MGKPYRHVRPLPLPPVTAGGAAAEFEGGEEVAGAERVWIGGCEGRAFGRPLVCLCDAGIAKNDSAEEVRAEVPTMWTERIRGEVEDKRH